MMKDGNEYDDKWWWKDEDYECLLKAQSQPSPECFQVWAAVLFLVPKWLKTGPKRPQNWDRNQGPKCS